MELIEAAAETDTVYKDAYAFQKERVAFVEYNHGLVSAHEAGLSEAEMIMIDNGFFIFTHSAVDYLANINKIAEEKRYESLWDSTKKAHEIFSGMINDSYNSDVYLMFIMTFLFLFLYWRAVTKKENAPGILGLYRFNGLLTLFFFFAIHIFIAFLCLRGRFPARVFFLLILLAAPYVTMNLCSLAAHLVKGQKKIAHMAVIMLIFFTLWTVAKIDRFSLEIGKTAGNKYSNMIESYVIENPDNFYVYDNTIILTMGCVPFKVIKEDKPVNLMYWGGWNAFSPPWYAQLERNGMSNIDYTSFANDNVFLMTMNPDHPSITSFVNYVEEYFIETRRSFEIVDELHGTRVIYIMKLI